MRRRASEKVGELQSRKREGREEGRDEEEEGIREKWVWEGMEE